MSKEIPEVGDVWQLETEICLIYRITTLSDKTKCILYLYKVGDGVILQDAQREDYFIKHFTYLGKSVVDVSKLFKVKRVINKERMKDGKRWCTRCKTYKDLDCFYINRHRKDGISSTCRECNIKQANARRQRNNELVRTSIKM